MIKIKHKKVSNCWCVFVQLRLLAVFFFSCLWKQCSPVQHMVNILCAVLLGPGYGVGVAFAASLIRNMLSLGSLMAISGKYVWSTCMWTCVQKNEKTF